MNILYILLLFLIILIVILLNLCNYKEHFNVNEIIFYKNFKDLCVKLMFYKKNPKERKKIAFNGWKKYHKFFNSSIVARFIVDKTFSRKNKYKYIWDKSP